MVSGGDKGSLGFNFHNGDMCVVVPLRFAIAIMFGSIDRSIASQLAIINYFVV